MKEIIALGIEDFGFGFYVVVCGLVIIARLGGFLPYGRKTGMKLYRDTWLLKSREKNQAWISPGHIQLTLITKLVVLLLY